MFSRYIDNSSNTQIFLFFWNVKNKYCNFIKITLQSNLFLRVKFLTTINYYFIKTRINFLQYKNLIINANFLFIS